MARNRSARTQVQDNENIAIFCNWLGMFKMRFVAIDLNSEITSFVVKNGPFQRVFCPNEAQEKAKHNVLRWQTLPVKLVNAPC